MGRQALATREAIEKVLRELPAGTVPTVERIRDALGGGSYTTISRVLAEIVKSDDQVAAQVTEVPSELQILGQQAVAAIYSAVSKQARIQIEAAEATAQRRIDEIGARLATAEREISRLEAVETQGIQDLQERAAELQAALERAIRAETALQASQEGRQSDVARLQTERQAALEETVTARAAERQAADQAARLQGVVSELRAQVAALAPAHPDKFG